MYIQTVRIARPVVLRTNLHSMLNSHPSAVFRYFTLYTYYMYVVLTFFVVLFLDKRTHQPWKQRQKHKFNIVSLYYFRLDSKYICVAMGHFYRVNEMKTGMATVDLCIQIVQITFCSTKE